MKIGIFGTGLVGQTIGAKLDEVGHDVVIGTRNIENTMARSEPDHFGNPPFGEWIEDYPDIKLGTFQEAAVHGELLFNATAGRASLEVLKAAGNEYLEGKVLVDISNPLDFSEGFPPTLTICNTDSLGEQIQRKFPNVKVVKTLNTLNAHIMVDPDKVPGDHNIFMSGNDEDAKDTVKTYLANWFGWKKSNIIDLGDITTARGTEMLLPIWVRLYGKFENPNFNFSIVQGNRPS